MSTYKKKLCNMFAKGSCASGNDCTFAHGQRELRTFENPIYKSQLCTAYEQGGICTMGRDCLLAHGEEELRTDDVPVGGASSDLQVPAPTPLFFAQDNANLPAPEAKKGTYKTALCIHFMKHGSCHLAASCTFAHGKEELTNVSAPDTNDPKYKTKLCLRFEQDEFCPNGELCVFAHGESELKAQSNTGGKKTALYKTTLCHNFTTLGVCPSGKNCSFAHGRYELRPVGFDGDFEAKIVENPKWKCVQCKIYLQAGHCNRINCDYAHGEDELRHENPDTPKVIKGNYKTVLCNNFMSRGFCFHEDACTFAHGQHELNSGKDATSALKLIRETNVIRKRTKGPVGPQGAMAAMGPLNPFMAAAFPADQKLFAEFLEFKKLKQQTDVAAGNVPQFFGANPNAQMRAAAGIPALPGAFDPLKLMANPANHPMSVNDLVSAQSAAGYYHAAGATGGGYRGADDATRNGNNIKREAQRSRYHGANNGNHNQMNGGKFERQKVFGNNPRGPQAEYSY